MTKNVVVACPGERRAKLQSISLYNKSMLNAYITGISPFGLIYDLKLKYNNIANVKNDVPHIKVINCTFSELMYRASTRLKFLRFIAPYLHRFRNYCFGLCVIRYFRKNHSDISVLHVYSSNTGETAHFIKEIKKIKPELRIVLEHSCAPIEFEEEKFSDELEYFGYLSKNIYSQRDYLKVIARQELKYADMHIVGSDFISDILIKNGITKDKIFKLSKPLKEGLVNYQHSYDFNLNKCVRVLIIGKVSVLKGSIRLIEAAKILGNTYEFRFAGEYILDQEVVEFEQTKLPSNCTFLGNIDKQKLSLEISKCAFGVHASLTEDDPNSVIEFLELGVPVIVSDASKERVINGINGFYISDLTPSNIAVYIKSCEKSLFKIRKENVGVSINSKSSCSYNESYLKLINGLL